MTSKRRRWLGQVLTAAGILSLPGLVRVHAQSPTPAQGPPTGPPWPSVAEDRVLSADATSIFYRHGGQGPVTVLFVHGWSCSHLFFGPQFAAVSEHYRFAALDLAGHGLSGRRDPHTVRAFADDVLAVAHRFTGPLVLVVHSAGGRVACEAAPRLGDRLLGVVGVDSFQNLGFPLPTEERIKAALDALRQDFNGRIEQSLSMLLPASADPALRAWILAQMSSTEPDQAIAAQVSFANADAGAAIAGFDKPVVALNSDGVPTHVEKIRDLLPRFSAQILQGQGHFPHLLNPDTFNPLLLSTLRQLKGSAAETPAALAAR